MTEWIIYVGSAIAGSMITLFYHFSYRARQHDTPCEDLLMLKERVDNMEEKYQDRHQQLLDKIECQVNSIKSLTKELSRMREWLAARWGKTLEEH